MSGNHRPLCIRRRRHATELIFRTPIVGRELRSQLEESLRQLAAEQHPRPVVLLGEHSRVFLAGADLGEIARLDTSSCIEYAAEGRRIAELFGRHPSPVVAAVKGTCAGGGFDLVMACDAVVAQPQATVHHPGVRRGLVTGWTGTTQLPEALGASVTRRAFLGAEPIDAETMSALGLVQAIAVDTATRASAIARRLAPVGGRNLAVWRSLRGPRFVDRFLATVVHKL
jgi:enoyl-CoA hydratase/carnithine racemase